VTTAPARTATPAPGLGGTIHAPGKCSRCKIAALAGNLRRSHRYSTDDELAALVALGKESHLALPGRKVTDLRRAGEHWEAK
jgi:hypothetical protein